MQPNLVITRGTQLTVYLDNRHGTLGDEKARQLIEDSNELVAATDVLLVRADNTPGELGRVLKRMAEAEVNIEYAYVMGGPDNEKGIVLCPSDIDTALAALGA